MSGMKVVIAGGSGLVGRALRERLAGEGWSVVVLSRRPGDGAVAWDGRSLGPWAGEMAGADAVVNLCGASVGTRPWTPGRRRELRRSRLDPTRALVAAIGALPAADRPRVLVNASGTDRYAGGDDDPAGEDAPATDSFLARLCADWEAEAEVARALGVRVVLARMSLVVAPDAPAVQLLAVPARLGYGGAIGGGAQWVTWVDLTDAVGIVAQALVDPALDGAVNVCAPDAVRQRDLGVLLARIVGMPVRLPVPAWPLRLAMGEQSSLLLASRRVAPARALAAGYRFTEPDIEGSLRRALGR